MIKLIKNEFLKVKYYKILITQLIFIVILFLLYKLDYDNKIIFNLIPFLGVFCSVYYSGIISNEINDGTFRYYLTKPVRRSKIFLSKFLTIIIYLILNLIFIFLVYYFLYKPNLEYIIIYIKYSTSLLVLSSIIMFNSTIIKNTSVNVGINIFLIVFGITISQILFGLGLTFIEYTFLPYLDFSIFMNKVNIINLNYEFDVNLSVNRGIIINLIFTILFYLVGNFIFNKKDIIN